MHDANITLSSATNALEPWGQVSATALACAKNAGWLSEAAAASRGIVQGLAVFSVINSMLLS